MAPREQGHPGRSDAAPGRRRERRDRRRRGWLGWLPDVLVLTLVAATFTITGLDLSDDLFGGSGTEAPAEVLPPEGLDLAAQGVAPPVAGPTSAGEADPALVRRALAPFVTDPALGKHKTVVVGELNSDRLLYRSGTGAVVPASTMKLVTALAALQVLGPQTRFHTTVTWDGKSLVLVGGGDPYLAASPKSAEGLYPPRGDLVTLAGRTSTALRQQGVRVVRLRYDASLFTGPRVNPSWPADYVPDGVVPPITALWADQGEIRPDVYVADPAADAARKFAVALRAAGIKVLPGVRAARSAPAATEVARIAGPTVAQSVERVLTVSDNNAAEVLAHHVGKAVLGEASFAAGARAVTRTLRGLDVTTQGAVIKDGSGLSRENRLTAATLLAVLRLGASADYPALRDVITGLPVAGFNGSLTDRFDKTPQLGSGRVRAKTGTLTGVHGLAGVAVDADGDQLVFVAVADRVPFGAALRARDELAQIAAALGACHCRDRRVVP